MIDDVYVDICSQWDEMDFNKNPYMFGEEKIDMEEYTKLVKDTYDLITRYKEQFKNGQIESVDVFSYSQLVTMVARYIPDTAVIDESENHVFLASTMIAEALVDYANDYGYWVNENTKNMDWTNKIQYKPLVDELESVIYDVNEADYSKMIECANEYCSMIFG